MKTFSAFPLVALVFLGTNSYAQADCALIDLNPLELDKNKNGSISRDEADGSVLAWSFDQVDSDGNGSITQSEFANRCKPTGAAKSKTQSSTAQQDPGAVEQVVADKANRQVDRASKKTESRVDKETDEAVDKAIDKGLDRLFGR